MKLFGGLAALLIVIGIGMYIWSKSAVVAIEKSKPARDLANQLAGQDENGVKAKDSIRLEPMMINGKVRSVLVEEIIIGGPMEKFYGLRRNDAILQAGSFDLKGEDDAGLCKAMILDAFSKTQPLIVLRDDEKISLPLPKTTNNPDPAPPQPQPAPKKGENKSGLQQQIDAIPGIR